MCAVAGLGTAGWSQPQAGDSHRIPPLVNVRGSTHSSTLTRPVSSPLNRPDSHFSPLPSTAICIFTYLQNVSFPLDAKSELIFW